MAEQPSLGGAIALQGRNTIAEQLGKMQFQVAQKEADRAAKRGIAQAKQLAETEKKFAIPKGQYHRLVVPEIGKTQAKYLDEVKTLKAERPNNWQNEIENVANRYVTEMEKLETLSRDLTDYDTKTSSIDKANTYFSKEMKKYNTAYENAQDLTDFKNILAATGFDPAKASDFIIRPNGSISYTPFANQKPLETIVAQVQKVPTIEYKEVEKPGAYGSIVTKKVQRRPATIAEAQEILKNNKGLFNDINEIQTIEDVVDTYLTNNAYGARQYADQNNLNLRQNPDGSLVMEDLLGVKQHIMDRVGKMTSPKVSERVAFAPRATNIYVGGDRDEGNVGTPTYDFGLIKSFKDAPAGAYRTGELNISYEKPIPSVQFAQNEVFDNNFKALSPRRLGNLQPDGLLILLTDAAGNPIPSVGRPQDDKAKVKGADVFMRFSSGGSVYYQKIQNTSNLNAQYSVSASKKDKLEAATKEMLQKAIAMEKDIANVRNQIK